MNGNQRELYELSVAAIYGGKELPEDFHRKLDALSDEEKMEVAKAIHDYSETRPEEERKALLARHDSQGMDTTDEEEFNKKELVSLVARLPASGQLFILAYARLLLAEQELEEEHIDKVTGELLEDIDVDGL